MNGCGNVLGELFWHSDTVKNYAELGEIHNYLKIGLLKVIHKEKFAGKGFTKGKCTCISF